MNEVVSLDGSGSERAARQRRARSKMSSAFQNCRAELIEESPCCCGGEWNSVIEAPAKFFSGGPFSPVGGDPRISGEQRHQIESPKRAPKESAQGRLPLPGFQKFVRLSWSFRQSGGLEYMSAGRCEVAVASPSYALGRASDVPQCQSGPLELGRRAFR
jgi:hypothetical protein